jgi:hypothetical protein
MKQTKKKKKLFVIDKAYKPCCFNNAEKLPVKHAIKNKKRMPSKIFNSMWNELWTKMRKTLILVSNYQAHPHTQNSTNIKLFSPPNTTSVLQPVDSCITKSFKGYFNVFWFSS